MLPLDSPRTRLHRSDVHLRRACQFGLLLVLALLASPSEAAAASCGLTRGCSSTTYCSAPLSLLNRGTCLARRTSRQSCTGLGQGTCVSGLVCDVRGECRHSPPRLGEYCGAGVSCSSSAQFCSTAAGNRCANRGSSGDACSGLGQGTCLANLVCDVSGECRHSPPITDEPCGTLVSCAAFDPNTNEPLVCPAIIGGRCEPFGSPGDTCVGLGSGTCESDLLCDPTGSCRHNPPLLGEPCGAGVRCAPGTGLGCSALVGGVCEDQDIDDDGYPETCGGLNETPCLLDDQVRLGITSCKPRLEEDFGLGLCIDACGGHGLPACGLGVCDSGLSLQLGDLLDGAVVCGATPINYGETDADQATPYGPRAVFYIHGRGNDLADSANDVILNRLRLESTNIQAVYGVDWNGEAGANSALERRRVRINQLVGPASSPEWQILGSYGRREFTSNDMQITEIAQAISQAIHDLEISVPITIVTHSYGGVIARQLVYRHYDELRANDHKIVEVLTIKGPHRGGLVGTPDLTAPNIFGAMLSGLEYQTEFACANRGIGQLFGLGGGQDGCQLGRWVQWSLEKAPFGIDNTNYPQIRWIAIAGGGHRVGDAAIDAILNQPSPLDPGFEEILEHERSDGSTPFLDSDETVSTRSAFGIALDACYPYVQTSPPGASTTAATVVPDTRQWDEIDALSATCYHAGAAAAPVPLIRTASDHDFSGEAAERDFVFSAIAVPEPGVLPGLLSGTVLLLGLRCRRQRHYSRLD